MVRYFQALVARSQTPVAITYLNFYSPVEPSDHHVEEERIREAAARLAIPFIPTSDAFRTDWARTGRLVNGFHWSKTGPGTGHMNPLGHQIVAQALAPTLDALLADPSGPRRLRLAQARAVATAGEPVAVTIAGGARS
jgi:lysophospholipase L1-like esterase